ncbi:unnamed protein product, partial [Mesorhabditis belari]|uniref:Uncharacterized protein n=1 Tax=Mesorhabditis belari TaxID=2138241 RepID=A0AAF3FJI6_9BILA
MAQEQLQNELNELKAESDLMYVKAKNGTLERKIREVNDENAKMRQQLQVLTAENKEKELVQVLEEMQKDCIKINENATKKLKEMEEKVDKKAAELKQKMEKMASMEQGMKFMTMAVEEKDREIFRLNEELKKYEKPAGKTNEKAFEGLVELLKQKLSGQRKECPSCEPDGQPPLLSKLWICTEHFEAKHKKSITEVPLDEIEEIVNQEVICADCIQHSHRKCQMDMTNLLELKKLYICEKMRQFLEMIKWKERIGERVPKTSAESAEERIRKKIDDLMQGTLKATDVDVKVEYLVESLKRFAQATADMEAQMEETMRNMIMIENDA